jgi:RNA polymerase sigma-70 factor (ECF subfamily)
MSGDTTIFVRECLKRMEEGDPTAQDELIGAVCRRMQQLARRMLDDYSRLRRWEETDDVFSGAALRLSKALRSVTPQSPQHFYRLAALQIRRELQEMVRRHCRNDAPQIVNRSDSEAEDSATRSACGTAEPTDITHDPSQLSHWVELHAAIGELPQEQRDVFEAIWYHQLTQSDAADLLGISRRTLIRRWQAACLSLDQHLLQLLPEKR